VSFASSAVGLVASRREFPGEEVGLVRDSEPVEGLEGTAVVPGGIARLWKPVINVTDLDEGERFWSAVSGLTPRGRHGQSSEFSVLDTDDDSDEAAWILLQRVPTGQASVHSGTHLDFRVSNVESAARQIEDIGGAVVKPPAMYPDEGEPMLEWAVVKDPFGNEFCIIRWPLT